MPEITIKTENNREDCFAVRMEVFVAEFGFQNEFDERDNTSRFATVYCDGALAGCGRLFPTSGAPGTFTFGRIAVRKKQRRQGLGSILVRTLEEMAREEGGSRAILSAKIDAVPFYESLGYSKSARPVFFEEGVAHQWMEKSL